MQSSPVFKLAVAGMLIEFFRTFGLYARPLRGSAGNDPAKNGTFKVAGNTGAIAAHLIPFANDLVLELIRPNPRLAFGGDTTSLQNQSYLLVSYTHPAAISWLGRQAHASELFLANQQAMS